MHKTFKQKRPHISVKSYQFAPPIGESYKFDAMIAYSIIYKLRK